MAYVFQASQATHATHATHASHAIRSPIVPQKLSGTTRVLSKPPGGTLWNDDELEFLDFACLTESFHKNHMTESMTSIANKAEKTSIAHKAEKTSTIRKAVKKPSTIHKALPKTTKRSMLRGKAAHNYLLKNGANGYFVLEVFPKLNRSKKGNRWFMKVVSWKVSTENSEPCIQKCLWFKENSISELDTRKECCCLISTVSAIYQRKYINKCKLEGVLP